VAHAQTASLAGVVQYIPKPEELKYTFGGHPPVMRIKPGTILESWTEDCYDGRVKNPTDVPTQVIPPDHDNPQTGPFYIEGAEPGDILVVHILKLEPARDFAVSSSFPGFGALTATDYTALLHEPLPEKLWWYRVDKAKGTVIYNALKSNFSVEIPMRPFLGCLSVAPARGEVRWTVTPEAYGGNMDCPEVRAGNTVYLPVNLEGALLTFGDGHLVQGEGEIIGTAVEAALNVQLQVELIKRKRISWPRIESDEYLMTVGSYRPLEDAFRIAHKELVTWLAQDFQLDLHDVLQLVSQVGVTDVTQVVDPNYTVVAKFPKKYLPPGEVFGGIHQKIKGTR